MRLMQISNEGLSLIKRWEGLRLRAYKCPAGVWTIGYGHTRGVTGGMTVTEAEADRLLREDVVPIERCLNGLRINLRQCQFDALSSFIFNVGESAFRRSTLLKKLQSGSGDDAIAAEFLLWNKSGGKVLAGLTNRRREEAELWRG